LINEHLLQIGDEAIGNATIERERGERDSFSVPILLMIILKINIKYLTNTGGR